MSLHPDRLNFDNTSWNIPQIVTVASQDDDVDEETRPGPDNQSFLVTVSSVSGGAKYGSLSEMSNYQGSADNLSFLSEDNDTRGIEIVLDNGSEIFIAGDNETTLNIVRDNLTISENGTQTQLVKIRLTSKPQNGTQIKINTSNNFNQDIPGEDFKLSPTYLYFTESNWSTLQTITVSAVDEDLDVENVPFTLTLTTLEQGTSKNNVYGVNVVTTTIQMTKLDNDTSEVVMTMVDNFTSEDDSNNTGSFKVNLTSRPLDNVRVDLQVEDSSRSLILNPDNLTFTGGVSGNWQNTTNRDGGSNR